MIQSENGHIEIRGKPKEVLLDLSASISVVADHVGKDDTFKACILGLYARTQEDIDKINNAIRICGFNN